MAQLEDIQPAPSGSTKEVLSLPERPDVVRMFFHPHAVNSKEQAESIYLVQSLARLIAGDAIPSVYPIAQETTPPYRYYMDAEKVTLDAKHISDWQLLRNIVPNEANMHEIDMYTKHFAAQAPHMWRITQQLLQAGIVTDFITTLNWSLAEGKIRYLDFAPAWRTEKDGTRTQTVTLETLKRAIDQLPEQNKRDDAKKLFLRLEQIMPPQQ